MRIQIMLMKEFHELVPVIDSRVQEFLDNPQIIPELLKKARAETAYVKYGLYQYVTARGPMNPDAFYEMDKQSSVRRGRLVNKQPNRQVYHRYAFNKNDQLLYFEWTSDVPHEEVILREGPFVWGLNRATTMPLHQAFITIHGNYIEDNRIVADFWTDSTLIEIGKIRNTLMHYENGLPVRYILNADCKYDRDTDGLPTNIEYPYPSIYKLYTNENGDVTKICRLKDEFDEGEPERARVLRIPVPRARWENRYGLV